MNRIIVACLLTLCALLAACASAPLAPRPPETILARVDGEPIRQADLDSRVAELIRQTRELQPDLTDTQLARLHPRIARDALDQLIDARLIERALARDATPVSDARIDERLKTMDEALRREGLSLDRLRETLRTTPEAIREHVREALRMESFWDRRLGLNPPGEAELRRAYDKNPGWFTLPPALHLFDALIPLPEGRRPSLSERRALRAHAEALRARLLAGEAFAAVARDAGGGRAPGKDGDLGWITEQTPLATGLLKAAFRQEVGRVGAVIESADGFHILVVGARRAEQVIPFEEVRQRLAAELLRKARESRIPGELKKIRRQAQIERE